MRPDSSTLSTGCDEAAALGQVASALGLSMGDGAVLTLSRYLDLLERWNAVHNLTSVKGRSAMRTQHVVDCMAIVEPFRRMTSGHPGIPKRILDVGSGGGLPGVVMAALLPEWNVVCVDSVGKKVAFITQVASELKLGNLAAAHARVEALRLPTFGVVTARAFSALSRLVSLSAQHLDAAGLYMAMKGQLPQDEMDDLRTLHLNVEVFHVEQLHVPGLTAERCIVWMRQTPVS